MERSIRSLRDRSVGATRARTSMDRAGIFMAVCILMLGMVRCAWAVSDAVLDRYANQYAFSVESRYGLVRDPAILERLEPIFSRIAAAARPTRWTLRMRVLNNPAPNAFALPNGLFFINRGLLSLDLTDDELAFVMAHEIAHVTLNHAKHKIEHAQMQGIFISILLGPGPIGQIIQHALQSGYSRGQETQADMEGLATMSRAGYDPEAALTLFKKLQAAAHGQHHGGAFADHPLTRDRIKNVVAWIKKHPETVARFHRPPPVIASNAPPAPGGVVKPTSDDTGSVVSPPPTSSVSPNSEAPAGRVGLYVIRGQAGDPAIRVTLLDEALRPVSLPAKRRPTVAFFVQPGAATNPEQFREIAAVARAVGNQACVTAIVTSADDEARSLAATQAHEARLDAPLLFDDGTAISQYGIPEVFPQCVVIGAGGRLRGRVLSLPSPREVIQALTLIGRGRPIGWTSATVTQGSAALKAAGKGRLEIHTFQRGVEVWVNGKPYGLTPGILEWPAGNMTVELRRASGTLLAFTVTLRAGEDLRLGVVGDLLGTPGVPVGGHARDGLTGASKERELTPSQ